MSFLDTAPPLSFADPAVRDLWILLSTTYYTRAPVLDLVTGSGLAPDEINWDQALRWVWRDILEQAHRKAKLRRLLDLVRRSDDQAVATRLTELTASDPVTVAPTDSAVPLDWRRPAGGDERVLGDDPTFLDIAFLRRGLELSAAVCKLIMVHSGTRYTGTGFVVGPRLLLTNHHNLFDHDHADLPASEVTAEFGYERTFGGLTADPVTVGCDVDTIIGDAANDWAVIKTAGEPPDATPIIAMAASCGDAPVADAPAPQVDDRVYIIQHPGGGPKKIGMIHNVVRYVDQQVMQYLTDTDQGSSGAPVFNERWQLVALHHRWVTVTAGGRSQFRNQGIRIERVVSDLRARGVI